MNDKPKTAELDPLWWFRPDVNRSIADLYRDYGIPLGMSLRDYIDRLRTEVVRLTDLAIARPIQQSDADARDAVRYRRLRELCWRERRFMFAGIVVPVDVPDLGNGALLDWLLDLETISPIHKTPFKLI